ncbi:MAG: leucine-rich repeat domain-containing protein [Firmicutes bacterium]|nr:leucine-rich repeat domain-containing protein [Bacillota bacterium]
MKKSISLRYVILLVLAVLLCVLCVPTISKVNAQSSEDETGEVVTPVPPADQGGTVANDESGINDNYLYQYLLIAYNNYYGLTGDARAKQIKVDMFSQMEVLDLSNSNSLIKNLSGLNNLNLENLKVLNVGRNQISSINTDDLKNLLSLEELILYDNNLTSLTIPSSLTNLKVLNLNKNMISSIDISGINAGKVYLGFNKFTSITDITFPRVIYNTDLYVELFNNNITDADEMYSSTAVEGGKITLELGLQGIGLNYKANASAEEKVTPVIAKSTKVKFYNSTTYPNMMVKISKIVDNQLVKTISNNADTKITEYTFGVGEYKLEYFDSSTNASMYDYTNDLGCAFKQLDQFKVVPTSPVVKYVIKGKEYDTRGKFSGVGKLKAYNIDDEGDIYYSIAGGDWVKGDECELRHGGQYNVAFKVVIGTLDSADSYESATVSKYVSQSLNPYIPDIAMLIIVVGIVLLLFFVALPLIIKYVIKK